MPATKKPRKSAVSLWQSYTCECPYCFARILVTEDARKGDTMLCPSCNVQRLTVDEICSEYRRDEGSRVLSPEDI